MCGTYNTYVSALGAYSLQTEDPHPQYQQDASSSYEVEFAESGDYVSDIDFIKENFIGGNYFINVQDGQWTITKDGTVIAFQSDDDSYQCPNDVPDWTYISNSGSEVIPIH